MGGVSEPWTQAHSNGHTLIWGNTPQWRDGSDFSTVDPLWTLDTVSGLLKLKYVECSNSECSSQVDSLTMPYASKFKCDRADPLIKMP